MLTNTHNDNRRYLRIAETLPVRFRFSDRLDSLWHEAQTVNISEGGMYLRTSNPLPEKKAIRLRFTLPLDTEEIEVTADVIRTEQLESQSETEPGMAVRFTDISEEDRNRIRNYIECELTEDLKWDSGV